MYKIIIIFIVFISSILGQNVQFNEQDYFKMIKDSYYTLNTTELQNFTALVTSLKMETFANDQWQNKEVFPFQLIWFKPDKLYLSQQGVPTIPQDQYDKYQEIVDGLKQQVRGIWVDLQRFFIVGIFESINENYILKEDKDIILISYNAGTNEEDIPVTYTMGKNGLCLKIDISYPAEKKQIIIYPSFRTIKTKWLCDGWSVQTIIDGKIESGFTLALISDRINDIWVPIQINISVQKAEDLGNTYYDSLKLKNYLFNQPLELLNSTNPSH